MKSKSPFLFSLFIIFILASCSRNPFTGAQYGYLHKIEASKSVATIKTKECKGGEIQNEHSSPIISVNSQEKPTEIISASSNEVVASQIIIPQVLKTSSAINEKKEHVTSKVETKVPGHGGFGEFNWNAFAGFMLGATGAALGYLKISALSLSGHPLYVCFIPAILGIIFAAKSFEATGIFAKKGRGWAVSGLILSIVALILFVALTVFSFLNLTVPF